MTASPAPFGHHYSMTAAEQLLAVGLGAAGTILADPPWQFTNKTGKVAPEHRRLSRYATMTLDEIKELPVAQVAADRAHLYLWVPNALINEGLDVMKRWGFTYKSNIIWYKVRKDGGPDRRGVGFYFRNVTEVLLFGVRGKNIRTQKAGRTQPNIIVSRKREHSRKPDEQYEIIEACSWGPYLELFARSSRRGWLQWGNEVGTAKMPKHKGYSSEEPELRLSITPHVRMTSARRGSLEADNLPLLRRVGN